MPQDQPFSGSSILETDQGEDHFTRMPLTSSVVARLLSFRSREAQEQALPSQDYARIVYYKDGGSVSFCVCDGVSSSYKGDFAAYCLARYLVKWLQGLSSLEQAPQELKEELRSQLTRLAGEAQKQLVRLTIPHDTPTLVREVLEELCETYGSEAVFLCGRIDYEGPSSEQGQMGQALFCWMGNVTARLFVTSEQYIVLGETNDRHGRWSTLNGCRGELLTWKLALPNLERLIVYTDGLDQLGKQIPALDDEQWKEQAQQLLTLPGSDDMTAIDLQWQSIRPEEGLLS
ncbi:protein phosphatase 2C domain-containing protein [Tengunoibacter tsumagoiensis]|uniref:PPM-type phosphatase domain-containing protein n=1 Tax=Tengunoibacter tsumagoiensis TaxID=2014871 RepID=A0A401ZUY0_9CHLR|nr:protein phosphatase 2C domain-containing protein [Tengunoibacter tsumagoiensis]GCE10540.1 hypothetical protein KTT_03990 [Tengunoibacter tsumagoiensis]